MQIHACRVLHPAAFPAARTKTRRNNEQGGPCRSAQAPKRSAHDDGSVTCDIVVVVGFSLLVPFLKWACAHQAGRRFQKIENIVKAKVFFVVGVFAIYINDLRGILLLLRDLNFSVITLKTKKMGVNFVVTEKGIIFVSVNDIQRGHEDVTRRQIIAVN